MATWHYPVDEMSTSAAKSFGQHTAVGHTVSYGAADEPNNDQNHAVAAK